MDDPAVAHFGFADSSACRSRADSFRQHIASTNNKFSPATSRCSSGTTIVGTAAAADFVKLSNKNSAKNTLHSSMSQPVLRDISAVSVGSMQNGHAYHLAAELSPTVCTPAGNARSATKVFAFDNTNSLASSTVPVDSDTALDRGLDYYIKYQGIFEDDSDLRRRTAALALLEKVCNNWIMAVYRRLNIYPEQSVRKVSGALFTFGSCRLGVRFRGGDIDTLLLAPRHVEREQFFAELPRWLSELPGCTNITPVPEAFAPIIKMLIDGVEIDLLFCRCMLQDVVPPDLKILTVNVINFTATVKDLRSLNGCRVNEYILSCVPNEATFRNALRAVKYWAKRRCIYSNVLGYFGGVSWALLVAFTCQQHPTATAAAIVKHMFTIFADWKWPKPVLLRDPLHFMTGTSTGELVVTNGGAQNLSPVWYDRSNPLDRLQLMPIITPVSPQQNTTYNVQRSQCSILLAELIRAKTLCNGIWAGENIWQDLFEPLKFFSYVHYIVVLVECDAEELFKPYCGFVESRLRKLVELVDMKPGVLVCRPHPRQFVRASRVSSHKKMAFWLFGVEFSETFDENGTPVAQPAHATPDLNDVAQRFLNDIKQETQQRARWCGDGFYPKVQTHVKLVDRQLLMSEYLPAEVFKGEYEHLPTTTKVRGASNGF